MGEPLQDTFAENDEVGVNQHEAAPDTVAKILIQGIEADNEELRGQLAEIDTSFKSDEIAQKLMTGTGVALLTLGSIGAVAFPPLAVGMVAAAVGGLGVVFTGEHVGKKLRLNKFDAKERAIQRHSENEGIN